MTTMNLDDKIELIKRRKMLEMMRRQILKQIREAKIKEAKKQEDVYEKIRPLMTEEGYRYLIKLRKIKKNIADKIFNYLIIGLLNGLVELPIDEITVEYLERKIEGRTGRILIERRGELKSLDEVFRSKE